MRLIGINKPLEFGKHHETLRTLHLQITDDNKVESPDQIAKLMSSTRRGTSPDSSRPQDFKDSDMSFDNESGAASRARNSGAPQQSSSSYGSFLFFNCTGADRQDKSHKAPIHAPMQ